MITPKMARRLGVAAFVGSLFLAPPFMGFVAGAADPPRHVMTGEVSSDPEVEKAIEIVETNTKHELYVADATMKVTAGIRFDGHPFEQNTRYSNIQMVKRQWTKVQNISICQRGVALGYIDRRKQMQDAGKERLVFSKKKKGSRPATKVSLERKPH